MLAFNPSSLTLFAKGHDAGRLADQLLSFAEIGQRLGVDLLCARPPIAEVAGELTTLLSPTQRTLLAEIHHELDHASVYLSTSFGAVANVLDQVLVGVFAYRMAADSIDHASWLADPHRCEVAMRAEGASSCDPTTYDLLCIRSLGAVLSGRAGMRDDQKITRGLEMLRIYLRGNSHSLRGNSSSPLRFRLQHECLEFFRVDDPFQPYFAGRPIGATALIEGQAVFVQEYELEMLGLPLAELDTFHSAPVSVYHITQTIWLQFFQDRLPGDAVRTWEYLWVLDLALWIPLFPGENQSDAEWEWADLHPGWRFLKICMWLRSSGYAFMDDDATADQVAPEESSFTEMICSALKWPTPQEIAGRWLNAHADRMVLNFYAERDAEGIFMHPRMRFVRNYFHRRLFGGNCDLNDADLAHFPMAAVICDDSTVMLPSGCWGMYDTFTSNRLLRLKEYVIYDFAKFWALGEGLGTYLLRKEMAELSAAWLGDVIAKQSGIAGERGVRFSELLVREIRRIRG